MLRFRTTYFLVSTLFLLLAGCASTSRTGSHAVYVSPQQLPVWEQVLRSDNEMNRYQVNLKTKKNTITGICLLKKSEDGWRGTLMNEMGAKAFDFMVTGENCKLMNVIPMMDKWYIRKTIADDLYFLFQIDNPDAGFQRKTTRTDENGTLMLRYGKKKITRVSDTKVTLENLKRNILYSLERIE